MFEDNFFKTLALQMPLELFVFGGSFVEEVIAPIPASLIVAVAGGLLHMQREGILYLIMLALFASVGKTLGGWVLYFIGDRGEHLLVGKFGKMLGVTETRIQKINEQLNKGWKDIVFIFLARIIPIFPSATVAVICGVVKINMKIFLVASFVGLFFRSLLLLYLGFAGLATYNLGIKELESSETLVKIVIMIIFLGIAGYFIYRKFLVKIFHQTSDF